MTSHDVCRRVLVTGVSGGIGRAVALDHAARGHQVVGTFLSHESAAQAVQADAESLDGAIDVTRLDITDADDVAAFFSRRKEANTLPEIVVCNAGTARDGLSILLSDDSFNDALALNLVGAFRVVRHAMRPMIRARWGRIVFVSSVAAHAGSAGQAAYAASKAGLVGLARSIAREVGQRGITVNIVAPGPIDTDLLRQQPDSRIEFLAQATPVGRIGTPEEVAAAVCALTNEQASYITGVVLPVDGGLGMGH